MRKESANTFQDALNYDLNPMVTPNTVLTDSVNGTFITFNGNELTLQNDAGNITLNIEDSNDSIPIYNPNKTDYKIGNLVSVVDETNRIRYYECLLDDTVVTPVDDGINWREYIVRLSPGFIPIAVKEYGGVLYIISRKQIGSTPDPSVDLIEFGSFPSPERYTQDTGTSKEFLIELVDTDNNSINDTPNILENPKTLNELVFRPGEFTTFAVGGASSIDFLSTLTTKKFYKLKLLQQLTSGFLDLTEDITNKYIESGGTQDHWILDSSFIYPCPYLYKGNLFLKLEIEPIESFEISTYPSSEFIIGEDGNSYTVTMAISSTFEENDRAISIDGIEIVASAEDFTFTAKVVGTVSDNPDLVVNSYVIQDGKYSINFSILNIPDSVDILNYTITPQYNWMGYSAGDADYLPAEYKESYTLRGVVLLSNEYFNVAFPLDIAKQYSLNNTCGIGDNYGYRIYNELVLTDGSGIFLDYDLEVSDNRYVLVSEGTIPRLGNTKLGTYVIEPDGTINTVNNPIVWNSELTISDNTKIIISNIINGMTVVVQDSTCLTVKLSLNVWGEQSTTKITITQEGVSQENIGTPFYEFMVIPNIPIQIGISTPGEENSYQSISDTVTISEDTLYNYMLLGKLAYYHIMNSYIVLWDNSLNLGNPNIKINFWDFITEQNVSRDGQLVCINDVASSYRNICRINGEIYIDDRINGRFNWYEFTDSTPFSSPTTFKNILNQSDYVQLSTIVFKKTDIFNYELDRLNLEIT